MSTKLRASIGLSVWHFLNGIGEGRGQKDCSKDAPRTCKTWIDVNELKCLNREVHVTASRLDLQSHKEPPGLEK